MRTKNYLKESPYQNWKIMTKNLKKYFTFLYEFCKKYNDKHFSLACIHQYLFYEDFKELILIHRPTWYIFSYFYIFFIYFQNEKTLKFF